MHTHCEYEMELVAFIPTNTHTHTHSVGNKTDRRNGEMSEMNSEEVKSEEADSVARDLGIPYYEISAKENTGIEDVRSYMTIMA